MGRYDAKYGRERKDMTNIRFAHLVNDAVKKLRPASKSDGLEGDRYWLVDVRQALGIDRETWNTHVVSARKSGLLNFTRCDVLSAYGLNAERAFAESEVQDYEARHHLVEV